MNFMDQIRKKMSAMSDQIDSQRGTFRPYRPKESTRSVIKHTKFDDMDWKDYARQDKDVDKGITDLFTGSKKNDRPGYDNAPELVQDVFFAFLKPQPMLEDVKTVKKDARLNGKFVEQMMELPEFERLHDQTMTDPVLATMAVATVMDTLRDLITQHRELVEDSNKRKREAHNSDEPVDTSGEPQGPSGKKYRDGTDPLPDPNGQGGKGEDGEQQARWDEGEYEDEPPQGGGEGDKGGKGEDSDDKSDSKGGEGSGSGQDEGVENIQQGGEGMSEDALDTDAHSEWQKETDVEHMTSFSQLKEFLESPDGSRAMNAKLGELADDLDELDGFRASVGLTPEEWKQTDPKKRLAAAERFKTPEFRRLAETVGRMVRYAMAEQATKITDAPEEMVDVEMGNDIRRVLRSEFGLLGHPDTRIMFYKKFVAKELLQFKEEGTEKVAKGPIVVCVDNSGSMSGEPENWAKGICEALRRICAEQKRDCHIIFFETNRHRERFDFPAGKSDLDKVLKMLSITAGGGTEFDGVLEEALAKCISFGEGESKGKSDIVFITDGQAYLTEEWIKDFNEKRAEAGVRVFSIFIGGAYDYHGQGPLGFLESFSDSAVGIKDLKPEDAKHVFSTV